MSAILPKISEKKQEQISGFVRMKGVMDTFYRYRKEEDESYPLYQARYSKQVKYHHSHERFVVPWQMEVFEKEKEDAK
jgi:hypothetical protein